MGKKKIDELFQEKFKDFEQQPDDKVWQSIEASLNKKKKRAIPLWWKLGGVAAVLAVGLLAINQIADTTEGKPAVTNVENNKRDSVKQEGSIKDNILLDKDVNESQMVDVNGQEKAQDPSEISGPNTKKEDDNSKMFPNSNGPNDNQITATQIQNQIGKKTSRITPVEKNQLVRNESGARPNEIQNSKEKVALSELEKSQKNKDMIVQKQNEEVTAQLQENEQKNIKSEIKAPIEVQETEIAQNAVEQTEKGTPSDSLPKKKSIYDEIIAQEEEVLTENAIKNRWSAGPSIAPVYFDAFGEGSPVHSILVPNSKSGNTNLSYGLSVAYQINDRLSVRSGLHKVDYGYETGEIEFSSSLDGSITNQMDNIDYAGTARNLVVKSKAGNTPVGVTNENNDAFDASTNSTARNGSMTQQFDYLEVPLEINYALIDKKVGVNLVGGFSSLFLLDNSVSLTDGNQTTQMGEANNVNSLNFSTNIGIGFDYDFSPNVKLNIEPVFKYQLNTFNQVDGTFNPFSIGLYSGLTFRF